MAEMVPMELIEADFYPADGHYVRIVAKLPVGTEVAKRAMVMFDQREEAQAATKPRPVHVEFWRCGATGRGGGWTKCPTWGLCKNHGCQRLETEQLRSGGVEDVNT